MCESAKSAVNKFSVFFAGRVHYAMVSKVNAASRSVTVEWYERGETKGKEVEMDMLLQLNPGICNITEEPTVIIPTQPTNLQRVSGFFLLILITSCVHEWLTYSKLYCIELFSFERFKKQVKAKN